MAGITQRADACPSVPAHSLTGIGTPRREHERHGRPVFGLSRRWGYTAECGCPERAFENAAAVKLTHDLASNCGGHANGGSREEPAAFRGSCASVSARPSARSGIPTRHNTRVVLRTGVPTPPGLLRSGAASPLVEEERTIRPGFDATHLAAQHVD
jgi:hypothetical protein